MYYNVRLVMKSLRVQGLTVTITPDDVGNTTIYIIKSALALRSSASHYSTTAIQCSTQHISEK